MLAYENAEPVLDYVENPFEVSILIFHDNPPGLF
jgi:hypothetical protein